MTKNVYEQITKLLKKLEKVNYDISLFDNAKNIKIRFNFDPGETAIEATLEKDEITLFKSKLLNEKEQIEEKLKRLGYYD